MSDKNRLYSTKYPEDWIEKDSLKNVPIRTGLILKVLKLKKLEHECTNKCFDLKFSLSWDKNTESIVLTCEKIYSGCIIPVDQMHISLPEEEFVNEFCTMVNEGMAAVPKFRIQLANGGPVTELYSTVIEDSKLMIPRYISLLEGLGCNMEKDEEVITNE